VAQFVGTVGEEAHTGGEESIEAVVLSVTGRAAVANALITATRHLTAATMPAFVKCVMRPLLRVARGEWVEQGNELTAGETTVLQAAALQVRGRRTPLLHAQACVYPHRMYVWWDESQPACLEIHIYTHTHTHTHTHAHGR